MQKLVNLTREEHAAFCALHEGEFVAIPIDDAFGFARLARKLRTALYDLRLPSVPSLEQIERAPILCTIGAVPIAMASKRWKVIGQKPLEQALLAPVKVFRHPQGSSYVDIYEEGEFKPYAGEDLTKMECLAAWEPRHVEERLRNHFAGRPDPTTESSKVPRKLAERLYREYWARQGKERP